MSSSLRHSPANILRWLLIQLGQGTDPLSNTTWPTYYDTEASSPDEVLTCYDTAPVTDSRSQNSGETSYHYGFMIRVRSREQPGGYAKAVAIADALERNVRGRTVTIDTFSYCVECITGVSILRVGKDAPATKRSINTINGMIVLAPMY